MEFSSWFVINRRCFVWFCVCIRFYSKFKMLTPEMLLLNKQRARHFIAFEYLVCVVVFVWNFGMRRNVKCIDCRLQYTTLYVCMITKTFACMMHRMAWKHSDPLLRFHYTALFLSRNISIIIITNEMSFKLWTLNLQHAFYTANLLLI